VLDDEPGWGTCSRSWGSDSGRRQRTKKPLYGLPSPWEDVQAAWLQIRLTCSSQRRAAPTPPTPSPGERSRSAGDFTIQCPAPKPGLRLCAPPAFRDNVMSTGSVKIAFKSDYLELHNIATQQGEIERPASRRSSGKLIAGPDQSDFRDGHWPGSRR
jgi:hypothetical protein